jgi:hypothetical protein
MRPRPRRLKAPPRRGRDRKLLVVSSTVTERKWRDPSALEPYLDDRLEHAVFAFRVGALAVGQQLAAVFDPDDETFGEAATPDEAAPDAGLRALARLSPGALDFYRSAQHHWETLNTSPAAVPMLFHALRELDAIVRDVWWDLSCFVDPAARHLRDNARARGDGSRDAPHRAQIAFLGRRWGLAEQEIATWVKYGPGAHSLAHRNRIGPSRHLTAEEAAVVGEALSLFRKIATAAESTYGDAILRAAALLETGPTTETAAVLAHRFPHHPALRCWFLAQVDHPGWLRPLQRAGLLAEAEPMTLQSDGCWVAPTSPGARATARLARDLSDDDLLQELVAHWLSIRNPRLHTDVVQVLIESSSPIYRHHVDQLQRWLEESPPHSWIVRLIGDAGVLRFPSHCLRLSTRAFADRRPVLATRLIQATARAIASDARDRASFWERANLAMLGAAPQLSTGTARRIHTEFRQAARSIRP